MTSDPMQRYSAGEIGDVEFLKELRVLGYSLPIATQIMVNLKTERDRTNRKPAIGEGNEEER